MAESSLRIALAQMNSNDDVETNLKSVLALIEEASSQNPRLIIFPENSLFFRLNTADSVIPLNLKSEFWPRLQEVAKKRKINLHLTTALKDEDGKVYNGSVLISDDGQIEIIYRKVHLFDIALTGQKPIRESDVFASGNQPTTFVIDDIKFGSAVCYDVRFSELFRFYAQQDVDVILVPSAFLVKTGLAHWEVLLRARAIESQCYVLAPAQAGVHRSHFKEEQRETFGNTLAVDPWGEILEKKEKNVGLIFIDINKQHIKNVRQQIPMKAHRKL